MHTTSKLILFARIGAALAVLLGACSAPQPQPSPSAEPTPTLAPTPTPSPTPSPADVAQKGDALFKQGDFSGAIAAYQRAIDIDDQYGPAYSGLGWLYQWQVGMWEPALENAQKGADLAPTSGAAQAILASALLHSESYADGLSAAKEAAGLAPEEAFVQSILAQAHLANQQYEEAREAAEKAYTLDPESADTLHALAEYHRATADFGRAEAAYKKAVDLEPDFVNWKTQLGDFYLDVEDFSQAEVAYSQALEQDADSPQANLGMAMLHTARKEYKAAETLLDQLASSNANITHVSYVKALLNTAKQDYKEAILSIDAALEIDPQSIGLRMTKAGIYLNQQECDPARRLLQDLLDEHADLPDAQLAMGYTELCAGDLNKALSRFREVADEDAYNSDAQRGLGLAYLSQQRYKEAETAMLEALRLGSDISVLHGDLANLFWAQGMVEEAETEFRLGIELNPYTLENYLGLTALLLDQNRPEEAVETATQAWELDKENLRVLGQMGAAYYYNGNPDKALYYLGRVSSDDPENSWNHYLLGLAYRSRGEFTAAQEEIQTYLALEGSSLPQENSSRIQFLVDALTNGYWVAEDKALEDLKGFFEYIFQKSYPLEVEEREQGRTLLITLPLTQAEIDSQDYLMSLGQAIGLAAMYAPRIDPPVDNGLELRLTRAGQDFLVVRAGIGLLREILDATVGPSALTQRLEFDLIQGPARRAALDKIMRAMAEQRDIEIQKTPAFEPISQEDLQTRIQEELDDEARAALDHDAAVLQLLEVITPSLDVEAMIIDLYGEQVAGLYDPDEQKMFLVEMEKTNAHDQIVIAHETVHALQDQSFDLKQLQDSAQNDDQALAINALIEGDASLGARQYMQENIPQIELMATAAQVGQLETDALENAPDFYGNMAGFPYQEGFDFVQSIFDSRGWEGVNQAFENPPLSSEQIMHPELYLSNHQPVDVPLPDLAELLGGSWSQADSDVFGEYALQLILAGYTGPMAARHAADGWGGDRYILLEDSGGGQPILVVKTSWDDRREAGEFWDFLRVGMERRSGYHEEVNALSGDVLQRKWVSEAYTVVALRQVDDIWILVGADGEALETLLSGL